MKIVAKFDDGSEVELKEIQGLSKDCDTLIMRISYMYRPEEMVKIEKMLTEKTGKKVVLLDPRMGEVLALNK